MRCGPHGPIGGRRESDDCDRISSLRQAVSQEGVHHLSRHPHAPSPIPEETQRVARAAFPRGTLSMPVADHLGPLSHDAQCTALCPRRGPPAAAPARLALGTLLQCAQGLADRHAAAAVRSRMDGQSVLGLDLTAPGFAPTVLRELCARRVTGAAAPLLLETLRTLAQTQGGSTRVGANGRTPPMCWL